MKYRPEIDGLRAVAVLPVVFFHAGIPWLRGGYVGVDIFFVISGYLITSLIVLEQRTGSFSIASFYERRARRILPVLFLVMTLCLPFAWIWMLPRELKAFCTSLVAVAVYASNFLFWKTSNYFDTASELKPLLHTWSLAVEEQYYLIFPVLAVAMLRLRARWLIPVLSAVSLASLGAAQWYSTHDVPYAYFLLPTRAWELMAGAIAAVWLIHRSDARIAGGLDGDGPVGGPAVARSCSLVGLLAIVASYVVFTPDTPDPSVYTVLPVTGASLVILFATPRNLSGRLLASRPMVGIGLISYGIYVWHQPLLAMARLRDTSTLGPSPMLMVGLVMVSLPLAWISWKLVELPMRQRQRIGRRAIVVSSVAGTCAFIVVGLLGYRGNGFPSRVPADAVRMSELEGQFFGLRDDAACNVVGDGDRLIGCTKGEVAKVPTVALIGDSQAASLAHALGVALSVQQRSFVQYTKTGCFPTADDERFDYNCKRYLRAATDDAIARNVDSVVFYSVWQVPPASGEVGFKLSGDMVFQTYMQSMQRLIGLGKQVIVIYPTPEPGFDVPRHMAKKAWFGVPRDASDDLEAKVFRFQSREASVALDGLGQASNLARIYPGRILCDTFTPDRCVTSMGPVLLYGDQRHLSDEGEKLIVGPIVNAIVSRPPVVAKS